MTQSCLAVSVSFPQVTVTTLTLKSFLVVIVRALRSWVIRSEQIGLDCLAGRVSVRPLPAPPRVIS